MFVLLAKGAGGLLVAQVAGRMLKVLIVPALLISLLAMLLYITPTAAEVGDTTRVSVASDGGQSAHNSRNIAVNADGRYVAFESAGDTFVVNDTNSDYDIFVYDRMAGATERVSVSSAGSQSNGNSFKPTLDASGRWLAFESQATNLVANDTNGVADIFLHDRDTGATVRVSEDSDGAELPYVSEDAAISGDGRIVAFRYRPPDEFDRIYVKDMQTGELRLVSVNSAGEPASADSYAPTISANGRYVVFISRANNLGGASHSGKRDAFIHDLQTGATTLVSVSTDGVGANHPVHYETSISADGRYVAFATKSDTLTPGDMNNFSDVFVRDMQLGNTTRVTIASDGVHGVGSKPSISADGRYVAFQSRAENLALDDTNRSRDIFVHDRLGGTTKRVSVSSAGGQANGNSVSPVISADGRLVVFESRATNLVSGDTNDRKDIFAHELAQDPLPTITCDRIAVATIVGTASDDILIGTAGDDVIAGLSGDDTLRGLGGNDLICGDGIINDVPVTAGDDTVYGDEGEDQLVGSDGFDRLFGGPDADLLRGNGNADELAGENGDDELRGGSGPDQLDGGPGTDILDGGGQEDVCINGETLANCP